MEQSHRYRLATDAERVEREAIHNIFGCGLCEAKEDCHKAKTIGEEFRPNNDSCSYPNFWGFFIQC